MTSASVATRRVARVTVLLALPLLLGACEWFTDFKRQPKVDPWEPLSQRASDSLTPPRGQPAGSVPVTGAVAPAYYVSYAPMPATVDSMSGLANPTPIGAASLDNGRKQFQINCAVCHGADGMGTKNPLLTKYGMTRSLIAPETQARTDGYIFGMIRNGRGLMPNYNRIEEPDRWDVVNYVRALQGRAGTPAITGPVGYPGENGNTVPRASYTAPTRPAPYVHPSMGSSAPAAPGHAVQPDSTKPAAPAAKGAH